MVRGADRIALPAGARVEGGAIAMPRMHVHRLAPNDVIEQDEEGRIVAVQSGGDPAVVTRFVPGTATSPPDADYVRGQLADDSAGIALTEGDAVEMRGTVAAEGAGSSAGAGAGAVAGESHVETTRSTGALVGGLVLLGLSYGPSAYIGLQTSASYDRELVIPVAGPWLDLAQRPACVEPTLPPGVKAPFDPCSFENAARALLVVSGATQGFGALLTVIGLPTHDEVVKDTPAGSPGAARTAPPRVAILPTPGGLSVSLSGAL
ncbi:MAG: hypothetical protein ACRENE_17805 [Polyangiaceae bacterium]